MSGSNEMDINSLYLIVLRETENDTIEAKIKDEIVNITTKLITL